MHQRSRKIAAIHFGDRAGEDLQSSRRYGDEPTMAIAFRTINKNAACIESSTVVKIGQPEHDSAGRGWNASVFSSRLMTADSEPISGGTRNGVELPCHCRSR